jgi:hypothetical protein
MCTTFSLAIFYSPFGRPLKEGKIDEIFNGYVMVSCIGNHSTLPLS